MIDDEQSGGRAYIEYVISQIRCPVCNHRYTADDIMIIDHKDEMWLMALSCSECETRGLVFAIVRDQQTQVEPLTELTPEEIARFEERGAITTDDVLNLHDFLRDYQGDVAELLGDEP